jgi:hypothetical protein
VSEAYNESFFKALGSASSAAVIGPIVADLVRPRSVIDLGCGVWDFQACGIAESVAAAIRASRNLLRRHLGMRVPADEHVEGDRERYWFRLPSSARFRFPASRSAAVTACDQKPAESEVHA